MTDDEIVQKIRDDPYINWVKVARKYNITISSAKNIVSLWQLLQPVKPIYKKEGRKLRKTKWNIGDRLYENYTEWQEAMNE